MLSLPEPNRHQLRKLQLTKHRMSACLVDVRLVGERIAVMRRHFLPQIGIHLCTLQTYVVAHYHCSEIMNVGMYSTRRVALRTEDPLYFFKEEVIDEETAVQQARLLTSSARKSQLLLQAAITRCATS